MKLGAFAIAALLSFPGGLGTGSEEATPQDWAAFGKDLAALQSSLASAESLLVHAKQGAWRWKQCRFQSLDKPTWSAREERLEVRCAAQRFGVSATEMFSVGQCESGFNRFAYNPNGPYLGIFQHAASAWPGRVKTYEPPLWTLDPSWTNSRTQAVVTARMAHANGWGAWTCA